LSDFNATSIFLDSFSKNSKISNFVKTRPVGSDLFHADGRTVMSKLVVAFHKFVNTPKKRKCTHWAEGRIS